MKPYSAYIKIWMTLLLAGCLSVPKTGFSQSPTPYPIIPRPAQLVAKPGAFVISQTTSVRVLSAVPDLRVLVENMITRLNQTCGLNLTLRTLGSAAPLAATDSVNQITFLPDTTLGDEAYRIDISPRQVTVAASKPAGFFYAIQSLYQLLPPVVLGTTTTVIPLNPALPACRINDSPRYPYRGMHLDVARHFFSVAFIKKYLDAMALHKFNTFHWHLTDDQGWRIEIKKYPQLTSVGANRAETLVGHYDDSDPLVYDGQPYGGFYTQDDIREVVRYAQARFITVIPEIEMPGHSVAALAAYPELGCVGHGYEVATKWGIFGNVYCPTEATFTFLENVLTEVMGLFPGPYIHIGGDECPKVTWRNNPFCRQLMKRLHLKNANQLQHYFIRRIDQFVAARGRRIMGWDEILQGSAGRPDLSAGATVMNWHSLTTGLNAARMGHDVVMTPGTFCYFDHYQADPAQEPTAFGEYLPLRKVYSYDPTPTSLPLAQARHILGAQGNLWTEYITTPEEAEYMLWPRTAALAEVVWPPADRKDYTDFSNRLPALFARLSTMGISFARSIYDVTFQIKPASNGQLQVELAANAPAIRYTTDGSTPTTQSPLYTGSFLLSASTTIRAVAYQGEVPLGALRQKSVLVSKATGLSYRLLYPPTAARPDPDQQLTNGLLAEMGGYDLTNVVSFKRTNFGAVLDLGQVQPISKITAGFLNYSARNICLPTRVDISLSEDGSTFGSPQTIKLEPDQGGKRGIVRLAASFLAQPARYVRIVAISPGYVPAGLRHPGHVASLAIDEITAE